VLRVRSVSREGWLYKTGPCMCGSDFDSSIDITATIDPVAWLREKAFDPKGGLFMAIESRSVVGRLRPCGKPRLQGIWACAASSGSRAWPKPFEPGADSDAGRPLQARFLFQCSEVAF